MVDPSRVRKAFITMSSNSELQSLAKKNLAKFGEGSFVWADWLCIGYPGQWAAEKRDIPTLTRTRTGTPRSIYGPTTNRVRPSSFACSGRTSLAARYCSSSFVRLIWDLPVLAVIRQTQNRWTIQSGYGTEIEWISGKFSIHPPPPSLTSLLCFLFV